MLFEDLRGKIVLVTGASRTIGIGAAVCRAFAQQGAHIMFTSWSHYDKTLYQTTDKDGPQAVLHDLRQFDVQAENLEIDLSAADAFAHVLDHTEKTLGQPTILVNNAAYSTRDGYQKLDAAVIDAHYAVNMRTTMLLSAEFARRYGANKHGRIINLSSGQSLGPMPEELAYIATKGAIEAFTRTLAAEVAHLGITVNAINPGATDTGWMTPEFKQEWISNMAMGRVGLPQDAARLIVFLASEAAGWITGQIIHSTGA